MPDADPFAPESTAGSTPPLALSRLALALALASGLVAGLASWAIAEFVVPPFQPPFERVVDHGQILMKAKFSDQTDANTKNAVVRFSLLGATLGALLGLAGGAARQPGRPAWMASALGLALGGALTAVAAAASLPIYYQAEGRDREALSQDLLTPMAALGVPWAVAGLVGGVALALGLGRGRASAAMAGVGGLLGGLLGGVSYLAIGSLALPASQTSTPLPPDRLVRLMAALIAPALAGLVAALAAAPAPKRSGPAG